MKTKRPYVISALMATYVLIDAGVSWFGAQLQTLLPEGALRSLLVDGVIAGAGSVLVFLPQILILFLFILLLEDSGYLPRAAYLLDRLMGSVGLSGRAFIPLLSSFACAVPGIMATRTIPNIRDRIATIMIAPLNTAWKTKKSRPARITGPAMGFITRASRRCSAALRAGSE